MKYYFHINGQNVGPLEREQIRRLVSQGKIKEETLVWKPGMKQWARVKNIPELLNSFFRPGVARGPSPQPVVTPRVESHPQSHAHYHRVSATQERGSFHESYAGFWKRLAAAFLDAIVTTVAGGLIGFGLGILLAVVGTRDPALFRGVGNIIGILLAWLYFALMESSQTQGTLGKMALGIKVTDMSGRRIGFGKATGRHFGKMISAAIFCIGFIMIGFTGKKQGLHDIMAGCLVVNK